MKMITRANAMTDKLDQFCRSWEGGFNRSIKAWSTGSCTISSCWSENKVRSLGPNRLMFSIVSYDFFSVLGDRS